MHGLVGAQGDFGSLDLAADGASPARGGGGGGPAARLPGALGGDSKGLPADDMRMVMMAMQTMMRSFMQVRARARRSRVRAR